MSWTTEEVRGVACPNCRAEIGAPCTYNGKGAEKAMRLGNHHQARVDEMVKARRAARSEGRRASQVQTAEPEPTSFDVIIHTDGACAGNPGPGGWGVVIEDRRGASRGGREFQGHALSATNNQMELMAAIMALEAITTTASIQIHSDSQYVIRGITRWIHKWKAQGWKVQGGGEVKNIGLWQRLDAARQRHKVRWCWVKGHAGNPGNERADTIACAMRDKARRLA